jgi:aspartate-semialdehyde dehydrogenase
MGLKVGVLGVEPVGEYIVRVLGERRFPFDGDITVMATKECEEHFDGKLGAKGISMDVITKDMRHIYNPNCSTIQMAVALYPLNTIAHLRRIIVSTYQSVSGHSGVRMDQLHNEIK